ncbi:MAG TPA: magnesium-translocating P-type ATPase [Ottowia sp.]|nr:magnesium-translocating P-type ATPase [Ottowia sp.]HON30619.1 magnesium-translocating P-type ATPase [Ottowia sp.]
MNDDPFAGLSSLEATERLARFGPNALKPHRQAVWRQFLGRFANPLVLLLLAASAVSAATGDATSAGVIATIVALSVILDFTQERRAGQAAEQLARQVAQRVRVWRDDREQQVAADALVPGDVVLLSAGDLIPADCELLRAQDFFVNQALLTGEPYPVERRPTADALPERGDWDTDAPGALFRGSSVVSGSARALVRRTARRTAIGRIASSLEKPPPPTAFETGTRRFGLLIMRLTLLLVLFTLGVNLAFQRPLLESFMFAVALAVGLTPELLPMVVSVTLARGALRMARAQVIVKRLSAIQDMGAMDVLCTDKTGTLTEARIRLERHVDAQGRDSAHVLELAYLNSFFESGLKSPMDEAILAHEHPDVGAWTKIDEVPFDFERRRVSVLVERAGERLLVLKGAPEDVLRLCTHYETESCSRTSGAACELKSFDDAARAQVQARFDSLGREGFRVLAIACKRAPDTLVDAVVDDESELVLAGFAAFLDPPKASARPALQALAASGVAVKVVTGDNEQVARHVMAELGMPASGVLTGAEIAAMNDDALRARVEDVNLFCRANPQQKNRVLLALKARGHVVGYLGDGINDAPSLHTADVGISVDGAVDVAKQAAAMILLENDLGVLHAGIREGRRTFGNVMKYIMMATSSNFGNMFSMALATLFLPFLPLLPLQILLNNFLYDLSELALPLDRVDEPELASPRRWDMSFIRDFMIRIGPISSVFDFATFLILLQVLHADQAEFRTGWFVESLATQVLVIFVVRTRGNPLASRPHRALVLAALAVVALAIALPFTPLASLLGFTPLPLEFFGLLALLVVVYLAVVQWAKRAFYRHRDACHAAQADSQ